MKVFLALTVAAFTAALAIAPAGAQQAVPVPCNGMLYTDPAGDHSYFDVNPDLSSPGNPNEDIRGLFFNFKGGVLTANIVVTNLDKTESGAKYATGSAWEVGFVGPDDSEVYAATAKTDGAAWSFEIQTFERLGTGQAVDPGMRITHPTKGQAFEGPNGVLSIEIPTNLPFAGIKPGAVLEDVDVISIPRSGFNQPSFFTDSAPDGDLKTYKITECPPDAPTTGPQDLTPPPPPTTPPPGSGSGSGSGSGQGQGGAPAPGQGQGTTPAPAPGTLPVTGTLKVDAAADKGKRKTAVKKGLRSRLRCTVQCKVTAVATIDKKVARKLKLGKKALRLGTGRATITKAGRIPFYVKMSKKVKKALKRKGVKKFALKVTFKVTDMRGAQLKTITRKSTLR
jgi:hypothetical protein